MTEIHELEDKARQIFCEALCVAYCGKLKITRDIYKDCTDEIISYTLRLYLNQPEAPLYFIYEGTEEGFLKAFRKEMLSRQIDRAKYYKGVQTDPGYNPEYIILEYIAPNEQDRN